MYKQVIVIRTDLKMGKGKLAAQAAHASLQSYKMASPYIRAKWEDDGCKKVVVKVNNKKELLDVYRKARQKLPAVLIRDAGHTQVKSGEMTAVGIGPASEKDLDKVTGGLTLL